VETLLTHPIYSQFLYSDQLVQSVERSPFNRKVLGSLLATVNSTYE